MNSKVGTFQTLKVKRFSEHGAYLIESRLDSSDEVLLPNKFVDKNLALNDEINVFLYTDSLDRITATTQTPLAILGEIKALKVKENTQFGCFLEFGLDKDIFMPSRIKHKIDSLVVVKITIDKQGRLIAKKGIKENLKACKAHYPSQLGENGKVKILPFEASNLGVGCVVEDEFFGLVFGENNLQIGIESSAFVTKIRKDGKLDLNLSSKKSIKLDTQNILEKLDSSGSLNFNYDSSPESIMEFFNMSKKAFKRALSQLIENKKIIIKNNKIYKTSKKNN